MSGPSKPEYGPRPIEEQRWRRHLPPNRPLWVRIGAEASQTSGTQRRRRKAILRRQWVRELAEKWAEKRATA